MCRQEKRGLTGGREAAICTMRCTHSGLSAAQNVRKELVPLAGASRGNSQPRSLVGVGGCGSIDWQLVHARGAPPPAAGGGRLKAPSHFSTATHQPSSLRYGTHH